MSDIKNTPLAATHISMGAKMVPFAGYNMPVRYTSLMEEHMSVRESVGVFDVSHMGEFIIEGEGALSLIQRISSNDASKLVIGQAQYSCMPNNDGGIVDDLIIYKLEEQKYLLVVNASNIEKDWNWISSHNQYEAVMKDISADIALIAVQGPKTAELLQSLTDVVLSDIAYYHFTKGTFAGVQDVIISGTGYTGAGGFELYVPATEAVTIWEAIFNIDTDISVLPAGLGARDTLRLEMGYCLYGNDIDDTTSPIEAGLGWITKFNHEFVNAAKLEQQKAEGVTRKLVSFKMVDKGIPRQGYDILSMEGEKIGHVTSGTISPCLDYGIGMGYIDIVHSKRETPILIQIRKNQIAAVVTKAPFIG